MFTILYVLCVGVFVRRAAFFVNLLLSFWQCLLPYIFMTAVCFALDFFVALSEVNLETDF